MSCSRGPDLFSLGTSSSKRRRVNCCHNDEADVSLSKLQRLIKMPITRNATKMDAAIRTGLCIVILSRSHTHRHNDTQMTIIGCASEQRRRKRIRESHDNIVVTQRSQGLDDVFNVKADLNLRSIVFYSDVI